MLTARRSGGDRPVLNHFQQNLILQQMQELRTGVPVTQWNFWKVQCVFFQENRNGVSKKCFEITSQSPGESISFKDAKFKPLPSDGIQKHPFQLSIVFTDEAGEIRVKKIKLEMWLGSGHI